MRVSFGTRLRLGETTWKKRGQRCEAGWCNDGCDTEKRRHQGRQLARLDSWWGRGRTGAQGVRVRREMRDGSGAGE